MTGTLIGYARCSTDKQDLTAQRHALAELGVSADRIYTDHGLTGTSRDRPGLAQALAAVRAEVVLRQTAAEAAALGQLLTHAAVAVETMCTSAPGEATS